MKPYYEEDGITIYNADCTQIFGDLARSLRPALVLTDPPYGINHPTDYASRGRSSLGEKTDYRPVFGDDKGPDQTIFEWSLMTSPSIWWGANHYLDLVNNGRGRGENGSWLVWDKRVRQGVGVNDQADGELAWTTAVKGVRIFRHMWNGMWRDSERGEHYHPTQKPVSLMKWCISKANPSPGVIFDPYMGAGPVAIAARELGFQYVGVEIDEDYCEIAARRLSQGVIAFGNIAGPDDDIVNRAYDYHFEGWVDGK